MKFSFLACLGAIPSSAVGLVLVCVLGSFLDVLGGLSEVLGIEPSEVLLVRGSVE